MAILGSLLAAAYSARIGDRVEEARHSLISTLEAVERAQDSGDPEVARTAQLAPRPH